MMKQFLMYNFFYLEKKIIIINFKIKYEFQNLRKLKHKNIVKVKKLFIDSHLGKIYTIMEFVNAPEMFEAI